MIFYIWNESLLYVLTQTGCSLQGKKTVAAAALIFLPLSIYCSGSGCRQVTLAWAVVGKDRLATTLSPKYLVKPSLPTNFIQNTILDLNQVEKNKFN